MHFACRNRHCEHVASQEEAVCNLSISIFAYGRNCTNMLYRVPAWSVRGPGNRKTFSWQFPGQTKSGSWFYTYTLCCRPNFLRNLYIFSICVNKKLDSVSVYVYFAVPEWEEISSFVVIFFCGASPGCSKHACTTTCSPQLRRQTKNVVQSRWKKNRR